MSKPKEGSSDKPQTSSSSSSSSSSKPLSLADKFKPPAGAWTCDSCMVPNKADANTCACCTAPKPGGSNVAKPAGQSKPLFGQISAGKPAGLKQAASKPVVNCGFGDKFKTASGSWDCNACLVPNKAEATKCVACQTPKPGAVNSSSAAAKAPSSATMVSGFGDKFKAPEGSWTCDTCMLSNKSTISRCVACDTPKPGGQKSLSAPPGTC